MIARAALPGSPWPDLFWPLVGVGVIAGALAASRLPHDGNLRVRLAVCYGIQAAGVAAGVVSPTLAGFALGSILRGLPFTAAELAQVIHGHLLEVGETPEATA